MYISQSLITQENGAKRQRRDLDDSHLVLSSTNVSADLTSSYDGGAYGHSPEPSGPPSPSPSTSTTAAGDKPPVTLAMLRALTKSMRQKYGSQIS
jgi:hypothetical protein